MPSEKLLACRWWMGGKFARSLVCLSTLSSQGPEKGLHLTFLFFWCPLKKKWTDSVGVLSVWIGLEGLLPEALGKTSKNLLHCGTHFGLLTALFSAKKRGKVCIFIPPILHLPPPPYTKVWVRWRRFLWYTCVHNWLTLSWRYNWLIDRERKRMQFPLLPKEALSESRLQLSLEFLFFSSPSSANICQLSGIDE